MITKIIIRTPIGQATKTNGRIKKFLVGNKSDIVRHDTYVSPGDDEIVWEIEAPPKRIIKITKNVAKFDAIMRGILENKLLKRTMRKKLSSSDESQLISMLSAQTSVQIVKEATAQEIVEDNTTWWKKIKKKFVKL